MRKNTAVLLMAFALLLPFNANARGFQPYISAELGLIEDDVFGENGPFLEIRGGGLFKHWMNNRLHLGGEVGLLYLHEMDLVGSLSVQAFGIPITGVLMFDLAKKWSIGGRLGPFLVRSTFSFPGSKITETNVYPFIAIRGQYKQSDRLSYQVEIGRTEIPLGSVDDEITFIHGGITFALARPAPPAKAPAKSPPAKKR